MKAIVVLIVASLFSGVVSSADLSIENICAKSDTDLVYAYVASVMHDFPNQNVSVMKAAYQAEFQSAEYANKLRELLKKGELQPSDFQF